MSKLGVTFSIRVPSWVHRLNSPIRELEVRGVKNQTPGVCLRPVYIVHKSREATYSKSDPTVKECLLKKVSTREPREDPTSP